MTKLSVASRGELTATISAPSNTNQMPTQNGMLSPKNDQLTAWHSPEPVNTIFSTSRNGNACHM